MSNTDPRPFDLDNPEERARLLREVAGYLKVSAFFHEGTDKAGREYAGEALLRALRLGYSLRLGKDAVAIRKLASDLDLATSALMVAINGG